MSETRPNLPALDSTAGLDDETLRSCVQIVFEAALREKPKRLLPGHKWCVYASSQSVKDLREAGIGCRSVQAPDWHHRVDDDEQGSPRFVTRKDCGFQHSLVRDPSHTWIELADGTILDPTITQFKKYGVKDWPRIKGAPAVAVIRPGDEYAERYKGAALPGNEHLIDEDYSSDFRF